MINEHVAASLAAAQAQGQIPGGQGHCTFKNFMDCKCHTFRGEEGAVALLRWIEKAESVFAMCNCAEKNKVKFASGTLEGAAVTWWNSQVQMLWLEAANNVPWQEFKDLLKTEYSLRDQIKNLEGEFWNLRIEGSEIEVYTSRYHELLVLCPNMVTAEFQRVERYLEGLVPQIQSMLTSSAAGSL
jgi:hypothetical protein